MTGDYTKVPLRREERWTGVRMQQGRVLLDADWNCGVDAAAHLDQDLARDTIGAAGVPVGSAAFAIGVVTSPALDLTVAAGRIWVDGLAAYAPEALRYSAQDDIEPLPTTGRALVYLDVWREHVAPAEDPDALIDPALAPVDTTARDRIGWRVRVAPTSATSCEAALAGLGFVPLSTGRLTVSRTTPPAPPDPCDPPGDPMGLLPDGLLRVEVLDPGTATTARFVWSAENGSSAVTVASLAGASVTLVPSPAVTFAQDDLVEVSWLARRADRRAHGALYRVALVTPAEGGDVLTLDRAVAAPAAAEGLVVRRWDGQSVGATSDVTATVRGSDLGLRFSASSGSYSAGDWWGAWLRPETAAGVEARTNAEPDGVRHAVAALALVDLGTGAAEDCRTPFLPLTELDLGGGTCTVTVHPGDDLQAAVDALPVTGGEVCIAAGTYRLGEPVRVRGRRRVVVTGVGPATVLVAARECAIAFEDCVDVEVTRLRAEGGSPRQGDPGLEGALTCLGCVGVRVTDCDLACPDAAGRTQTCVTVRSSEKTRPERVEVTGNRCEVGSWQTGVLVVDPVDVVVDRNAVRYVATGRGVELDLTRRELLAHDLTRLVLAADDSPRTTSKDLTALREEYARASGERRDRASAHAFLDGLLKRRSVDVSERLRATVGRVLRGYAAAGQGVVVAGTQVGTVRVVDNAVTGALQGIHVAASHADVEGRESVAEVLVARNVVHARVPWTCTRERHAVFVGNAASVHVLDTVASVERVGARLTRLPTSLDGIRVYGVLGPFLVVRHSSLRGFSTGVRVRALAPQPDRKARMWLVAETMAVGASTGTDAPDAEVERSVP